MAAIKSASERFVLIVLPRASWTAMEQSLSTPPRGPFASDRQTVTRRIYPANLPRAPSMGANDSRRSRHSKPVVAVATMCHAEQAIAIGGHQKLVRVSKQNSCCHSATFNFWAILDQTALQDFLAQDCQSAAP